MSRTIAKNRVVFKSSAHENDEDILWTERQYCIVCDADFVPTKQHHEAGICTVCFVAGTKPVEIPRLELRP